MDPIDTCPATGNYSWTAAARTETLEDITPILERELIEGQIDAAFARNSHPDSRLTEISLYDEPFWIALPNKHPLAEQDIIDVYDISMEEFLLLEDGHCFRDQDSIFL